MTPTKVFLCPGHHGSECRWGITMVLCLGVDTFIKVQPLQTFTVVLDKRNKASQKSQKHYTSIKLVLNPLSHWDPSRRNS